MRLSLSEPSYRGRGFGKEATLMMMSYGKGGSVQEGCDLEANIPSDDTRVVRDPSAPETGAPCFHRCGSQAGLEMFTFLVSFAGVRNLGITKFEAKIGQENETSICMFKKLHFKEV